MSEPAHPFLPATIAEEFNYGTFSARFGNIYTARQLVQLLDRAYGRLTPLDEFWLKSDYFIDPFRPTIQPRGFASLEELRLDREQHFAAVRRMVEEMHVLVFTFGLTECWANKRDGVVYPLCPGTAGGQFDPEKHVFLNQTFEQVVEDFSDFVGKIRQVNSKAKLLLTVSPVPLVATAMDRHVLVSTTYSKSVLRVAAERLAELFENVAYFPSYEIITGCGATGSCYFSSKDSRSVLETGVEHVMRLFFQHYAPAGLIEGRIPAPEKRPSASVRAQELVEAICDETVLDALEKAKSSGAERVSAGG